jgi:carbonic anhydrase
MGSEAPRTAIVTCMDARLDAAGLLAFWPGVVHVTRNAGGRVTADVLRSVAASCAMGTERVLVVHHTDCAMAAHTDEELRALLPAGADPDLDFLAIGDPQEALRQDIQAIISSPLLPAGVEIRGFIYDLNSRDAYEVGAGPASFT